MVCAPDGSVYIAGVTGLSTDPAVVDVYAEDAKGWLAGGAVSVSASLAPGEAILRTLTIDVPASAVPGDVTVLKATASIAGQPPETSAAIFEVAKPEPCGSRGCQQGGDPDAR